MLVFTMTMNLLALRDPWLAVKLPSLPLLEFRAMQLGFDGLAVIVGVVIHLAVAVTWAVGFGLLFYGLSTSLTLATGLLWGLLVWVTMYDLVLPSIGASVIARMTSLRVSVVTHLVYGLTIAVAFLPFQTPPLFRRMTHGLAR